MKNILSYLLLCIYATIMIKPVMPTVTDVFAHVLNYKEHMATVHKHNGKFHVHYDYIEAAKKTSHEDNPYSNSNKKRGSSDDHTLFVVLRVNVIPEVQQDQLNLLLHSLPLISMQGDLRPPIKIAA